MEMDMEMQMDMDPVAVAVKDDSSIKVLAPTIRPESRKSMPASKVSVSIHIQDDVIVIIVPYRRCPQ